MIAAPAARIVEDRRQLARRLPQIRYYAKLAADTILSAEVGDRENKNKKEECHAYSNRPKLGNFDALWFARRRSQHWR
jgi:hypothetical protein